jgi:Flp pilus assembly protein TadG
VRLVHPTTRRVEARRAASGPGREAGQSLVEFSLVLMPLFLVLLGIMQFGFIFNTYVTMTNAAREATRVGSVYVYNSACTKAQNDVLRNEAIRAALVSSMNQLTTSAPRFTTTAPTGSNCAWSGGWTTSGTTHTNGDLVITYVIPSGITDEDSRDGQQITVQATYHQDLIVPVISNMLPKDTGGRMPLSGVVTMVIDG